MTKFKASDLTRAMKAVRAAGVTNFVMTFDDKGSPVIRVGGTEPVDSQLSLEDELDGWKKEQDRAA